MPEKPDKVHLRGDINLEVGEYLHIIELKTAELFRVSLSTWFSRGGRRQLFSQPSHGRFGRHLGRAYQIFDDAADFLGKEDKLGKTLGTDLASRKLTLPALLLRDQMGVDALLQFLDKLTGSSEAARDAVTAAMVQNNVFHEGGGAFSSRASGLQQRLWREPTSTNLPTPHFVS